MDFTLVLYVSASLVFVPMSYPIAIVGEEARREGRDITHARRPANMLPATGYMLILGLAAMYILIAYRHRSVAGMVVAGSIAVGAYVGVMRAFWKAVLDMRKGTSPNESERE
jgi:hypothetical protein